MYFKEILGVILAGGKSIRMGKDKCRLPFGDGTLLSSSINLLRRVVSDYVVIADSEDRYSDVCVPVWGDLKPGIGPLGGIFTAFTKSKSSYIIVIACDMPFLEPEFLEYMVNIR